MAVNRELTVVYDINVYSKAISFGFIIAAQPSDLSHSGSQRPSLLSVMTHACALETTGNLKET